MEGEAAAAPPATPAARPMAAPPQAVLPAAAPATPTATVVARAVPRPPVSASAVPTPPAQQQSSLAEEVLPEEVAELAADREEKQVCRPRPPCKPALIALRLAVHVPACISCFDGLQHESGPATHPPQAWLARSLLRTWPQQRLRATPWQGLALLLRGTAAMATMAGAGRQRSHGRSCSILCSAESSLSQDLRRSLQRPMKSTIVACHAATPSDKSTSA